MVLRFSDVVQASVSAPVQPLALELLYATGAAAERKKKWKHSSTIGTKGSKTITLLKNY